MTATSTDRHFRSYGTPIQETHPVKSGASLKVGALANFDANGELVDATDAASQQCAGIVIKVNSDSTALIAYGYAVELYLNAAVTAAFKNVDVVVDDNQTVTTAADGTNDVVVGKFLGFVEGSTSKGYVMLRA